MLGMGITEFGGNDKLKALDLPRPEPRDGEVLIRVKAAGVNPVDYKIREGRLERAIPHAFPLVLGWEAAGVVEEVGAGVRSFRTGDEVYTCCRKDTVQWGTFAEFVAVPEASVARKPASLSFAEAGTVPLAGLTAWQMLFDTAELMPGQTVLVHAAAGGVGGYATELAAWRRAQVVATARSANHEYVRNLGARHVIDYQIQDFRGVVRELYPAGVDVALDCVGGETRLRTAELIKKGGHLVSIVDQLDARAVGRPDITFSYVFVSPSQRQLGHLGRLIDGRFVTPHLTAELPLDQAAKGLEMIQSGHFRGKLALLP